MGRRGMLTELGGVLWYRPSDCLSKAFILWGDATDHGKFLLALSACHETSDRLQRARLDLASSHGCSRTARCGRAGLHVKIHRVDRRVAFGPRLFCLDWRIEVIRVDILFPSASHSPASYPLPGP